MLILAFDTAMAACSAAVVGTGSAGSQVLAERHEARTRGHAEVLVPMIAEVLAEAGVAFTDLDRIAVTTGPGTFTGVRIGVATARGMAVASGLPVVGVTTLEAVAAGARKSGTEPGRAIASVFDARRDEVYVQCFSHQLEPLTAPQALGYAAAWATIKAHRPILAGTGAALLDTSSPGHGLGGAEHGLPDQPTAAVVAEIAVSRSSTEEPVVPLYLRAPDAKLPA